MTDALNPALPIGSSQVEVSSELRGIKGRLVADKAAIEALQVVVTPLNTMGAIGAQLLASTTQDSAQTILGATAVGKTVFKVADLPTLQAYLGIGSDPETIDIASGNAKGTITWLGGFMLNFAVETVAGGGGTHAVTWKTPFTTVALAGWIGIYGGDQAGWMVGAPTLAGATLDHNNGSSKTMVAFAIGV